MIDPGELPRHLPEALHQRLAQGERIETIGQHGPVVWHAWGKTQAGQPPVVLLHGGSGSWTHWVKNVLPLADAGRRVLAADLPGFGDSAPPARGTDADAVAALLPASLHQLVGAQPIDLVGFSMGGFVAGRMLAAQPQLARRLVLVGAPAMGVLPGRQFQLRAWRHLKTAEEQAAVHRHNLGVLMLHELRHADDLALEVHVVNVLRDRMPGRRPPHADELACSLRQVSCPVHAIYGAHDAVYGPYIGTLSEAYAAAAPDFRGIELIEGAGHWVQFEAPQAFNAALQRALQG